MQRLSPYSMLAGVRFAFGGKQIMVTHEILKSHKVLSGSSLSAIRERLARDYCGHDICLLGSSPKASAEFRRANLNKVSLNFLRYGAEVGIDIGPFNTFYMIELPLAGCASISYGSDRVESRRNLGVVISPVRPVRSTWSADCSRLMIQINRDRLEGFLAGLLNVNLRGPLEFNVHLDTSSRNGAALRRILFDLAGQLDVGPDFSKLPFFPRQCERVVMSALLSLQPHNYTEALALAADERPCHPGFVRRAQAFINDHFSEDISLDQIAAAAGVSPRSLFRGFRRYIGASPMSILKQRRLDAARDELLNADASESVTNIAHRWGFAHVGRFALDYGQRYGEKPSETLRSH